VSTTDLWPPDLARAYATLGAPPLVWAFGSAADGWDQPADADFMLVWPDAVPSEDTRRAALQAAGVAPEDDSVRPEADHFSHGGLLVDVWHVPVARMETVAAALARGDVPPLTSRPEPDPLGLGFIVTHAVVVADPCRLAPRLRRHVEPFPEPLRERLLHDFHSLRWGVVPEARRALRRGHVLAFEVLMVTWVRALVVTHFAAHGHFYPGHKWCAEWAGRLGVPSGPIEAAVRCLARDRGPEERLEALREALSSGSR